MATRHVLRKFVNVTEFPDNHGMDWTVAVLMLFPAVLIGSAFGILVALALVGVSGLQTERAPVVWSVGGALLGIVLFLLTARWWPPVIGPFILSPACAMIASLIAARKLSSGGPL
jgi:hypothetical protein